MQVFAILILLLAFGSANSKESLTPLSEDERLELNIYRARLPQIEAEVTRRQECDSACMAHREYLVAFYKRQTALGNHEIAAFEWQLKASRILLGLVALISCLGVTFAGYQLWIGTRPRRKIDQSVDIEISIQRIRLQSSVIGISVLAISVAFFLVFVQNVYHITFAPTAITQDSKK